MEVHELYLHIHVLLLNYYCQQEHSSLQQLTVYETVPRSLF